MILQSAQKPVARPNRSRKALRRRTTTTLKKRTVTPADDPRKPVDLDPNSSAVGVPPTVPERLEAVSASIDPKLILNKLPLADAVLSLCSFVLSPAAMDRIFQAHRGQ